MLVADTGGPTAGISHYAGVRDAAVADRGRRTRRRRPARSGSCSPPPATGCGCSRPDPRLAADCAREGIELLLEHARERYALTVIDCGTLAREADQIALASASHVAWVLPATAGAVTRGRQLLDAIAPAPVGQRDPRRAPRASATAEGRCASCEISRSDRRALLILLPSVPELATGNADAALETAQVPLQAILGALAR